MANILTPLIPSLFAGLDTVSRELVGYIPAAARSATAERASRGDPVTFPVTPEGKSEDIVAAMRIPEPPGHDMGGQKFYLTKAKTAPFGMSGEEELRLRNGGNVSTVIADLFAQGLRVLVNEMEQDGATEARLNASRAYGTPGTTPFDGTIRDGAEMHKILVDNGAPMTDKQLVLTTTAGVNLRDKLSNKVNEAGTDVVARQGVLVDVNGFAIRESAADTAHVSGDAAGATTNAAGYAKGEREITLAAAGTGSIKRGDAITFAGDPNVYMVEVGTDAVSGSTIKIQEPGLRQAIDAEATAVSVKADYEANVGFHRNALMFAARPPALPEGGDAAVDRTVLQDPRTGLAFEVKVYRGYNMNRFEVGAVWGWKATQPRHMGILFG